MSVVNMDTEGKCDMNGITTTRCSLMVEVRRSVIYRLHLVMLDFSSVVLSYMCWSNRVLDQF